MVYFLFLLGLWRIVLKLVTNRKFQPVCHKLNYNWTVFHWLLLLLLSLLFCSWQFASISRRVVKRSLNWETSILCSLICVILPAISLPVLETTSWYRPRYQGVGAQGWVQHSPCPKIHQDIKPAETPGQAGDLEVGSGQGKRKWYLQMGRADQWRSMWGRENEFLGKRTV